MLRKVRLFGCLAIGLGMAFAFFPGEAKAIPPFGSQYNAACAMCHTVWPQLNKVGNIFLANGYRLPGEVNPSADLGSMIGLDIESWLVGQETGRSTDFQLHKIEVLAGGPLGRKASAFVEAYIEERGAPHAAGDVFIQMQDVARIGKTPIHLRLGQFQPSLLIPDSQRLSVTRTLVYNEKINGWRLRNRQRGLELFTYSRDGTSYVLSLLNGNGNHAEQDGTSDNNDTKDFALAINQSLPWELFGGSNSAGLYAYFGEQTATPTSGSAYDDRFNRVLLQFDHTRPNGNHRICAAVMFGSHKNPNGDGVRRDCRGAFVEGNYSFNDRTVGFLRWDRFDPDNSQSGDAKREFVVGTAALTGPNTKLTGQYRFRNGSDNNQLLIETEAAF